MPDWIQATLQFLPILAIVTLLTVAFIDWHNGKKWIMAESARIVKIFSSLPDGFVQQLFHIKQSAYGTESVRKHRGENRDEIKR